MIFEELNLHKDLLEGLALIGFKEATPIQEKAIPLILDNHDLIACAQTGTGKTAAFLLPVISKLIQMEKSDGVKALIVVPTRELAVQIDQMLQGFAYFTSISAIAMYGGGDGASFTQQKNALIQGADIIITTPGKLISHLNMKYTNLENLEFLVLDEADKMLDMGFYDDIMRIVDRLPKERQTLLFSATMPTKIRKLSKQILQEPEQINIALTKPAEGVTQIAFWVYDHQKIQLVNHILKVHQEFKTIIIFSSRKDNVKQLARALSHEPYTVREIHSDLEQSQREDIIREFKNKQVRVLVGTDVIARGLDVEGVDLVINFEVPQNAEDYVHRVGRTARAASQGFAFTFVNEKEQQSFYRIEKVLEMEITRFELPAYIGEGPSPVSPKTSSSNFKKKKKRKKRPPYTQSKPGNQKRKSRRSSN